MTFLSVIGPIEILLLGIIYFILLISSLFLVLKHEKSLSLFIWMLFIIFVPFLGSLLYVSKHLITNHKMSISTK